MSVPKPAPFWTEWPTGANSPEGFLYVLEFSFGVVKVGQTARPKKRASEHDRAASRFGGHAIRWWLSKQHREYLINEVTLIQATRLIGQPTDSAEYFTGCDFDAVVGIASKLPMNPADLVDLSRWASRPQTEARKRTQERVTAVRKLHAEGLSYRDIALRLKVSLGTVARDLTFAA